MFNYASEALNNSFFLQCLVSTLSRRCVERCTDGTTEYQKPPREGASNHEDDISSYFHMRVRDSFGDLAQLKSTFSATALGMLVGLLRRLWRPLLLRIVLRLDLRTLSRQVMLDVVGAGLQEGLIEEFARRMRGSSVGMRFDPQDGPRRCARGHVDRCCLIFLLGCCGGSDLKGCGCWGGIVDSHRRCRRHRVPICLDDVFQRVESLSKRQTRCS